MKTQHRVLKKGNLLQRRQWSPVGTKLSHHNRERILIEHREIRDFPWHASRSCRTRRKQLHRDPLRRNIIWGTEESYAVWSTISNMQEFRVESADRARQESGLSFTLKGWKFTKPIDLSDQFLERKELAMHRIGQKRKSSSKRSYEESLIDRRIEKLWRTHASTSRESDQEFSRKVVSGKHCILTDRNCEVCKRTKITRAPCRKRNGDAAPRGKMLVTWWQQVTKFSVKKLYGRVSADRHNDRWQRRPKRFSVDRSEVHLSSSRRTKS